MKALTGVVVAALVFSACGWPIDPQRMPEVMRELGKDTASGCFAVAGRGGGGTVVMPMPAAPGGAYGSGEILLGRVNAPNTKLTMAINGATCTIERGAGADAPKPPTLNFTPNVPGAAIKVR